jgi:transcriptional regulator with XRE-family HTH domain
VLGNESRDFYGSRRALAHDQHGRLFGEDFVAVGHVHLGPTPDVNDDFPGLVGGDGVRHHPHAAHHLVVDAHLIDAIAAAPLDDFTYMGILEDVDTAAFLRTARTEAGLKVSDLARRSGVAESRISDYEHGRHEPSAAMLRRLLDATGHDLLAVRRRRVDVDRNARVFADVLSLVDAMPFDAMHRRSGRARSAPPTWAELLDRNSR